MMQPANLLVLDEPTNDLDMATLAVLEECLTEFQGAILLVTHDRYFLDQVANQILSFSPFPEERGQITSFASLGQWETWFTDSGRRDRAQAGLQSSGGQSMPVTSAAPEAKKRKLSFKEQRELDSMEENLRRTEKELSHWTAESIKPENTSNAAKLVEIAEKMTQLQSEIERLYSRWSELE
jgi:ATP-binding cassette subfamily F protein uup